MPVISKLLAYVIAAVAVCIALLWLISGVVVGIEKLLFLAAGVTLAYVVVRRFLKPAPSAGGVEQRNSPPKT